MNYKEIKLRRIESFPGYSVTRDGRVYSHKREIYLKGYHGRYSTVMLYRLGKGRVHLVHRLVASLYCIKPEGKNCVNHKDGDRENNHADNLEWCTAKENVAHALSTGLTTPQGHGEANSNCKLTESKVKQIMDHLMKGNDIAATAKHLKVSRSNIKSIAYGLSWEEVGRRRGFVTTGNNKSKKY